MISVLNIILSELERQHGNKNSGLRCLDTSDPSRVIIDGYVDLLALASVIEDKAEALGDLARYERS